MIEKLRTILSKISDRFSSYLLVVFTVLLVFSLFRNMINIKKVNEKVLSKEQRVESIGKENEELKKKLESVTSQEFIEKQLRDKLGMAREGEIVVVLPDDDVLRRLAPQYTEEEEELTPPTWKKWMNLFF